MTSGLFMKHIMDRNRSIKSSQRKGGFKPKYRKLLESKIKKEESTYHTVSSEVLEKIKESIRAKAKKDRRRGWMIFGIIFFVVLFLIGLYFI